MPTYLYRARDSAGKPVKGSMDGRSKAEIIDKLRQMGYMTTQITETSAGIRIESVFERFASLSAEEMIVFYAQLASMVSAGITILASFDALERQSGNKRLKEIVGGVKRSIESGESFSQAISKYPKAFPGLFVSMAKAGEASGKLDTILAKFAIFSEQQEDLRQKVQGALFYPMLLLCAGVAVTLFIVTSILPQFAEIFLKSGIMLPVPTLILYKIGTAIKRFWFLALILAIAVWAAVKFYAKTPGGRLKIDRLKLKMPLIGSIYRKVAISRFARILGLLVASGVPILQSLDIIREVVGNVVLGRVVSEVRNSVEKGERISESLRISEEFPADIVQMISAGEESGNLDNMLNKAADLYDMSLGYTIKKLTTIIEPLFLLIMGCMVGFIMASMLLPMFDMIKLLRS